MTTAGAGAMRGKRDVDASIGMLVFLLAFTRGSGCVVKQGLWRNPVTRAAVTLAEYITNDPTSSMIEAVKLAATLAAKRPARARPAG